MRSAQHARRFRKYTCWVLVTSLAPLRPTAGCARRRADAEVSEDHGPGGVKSTSKKPRVRYEAALGSKSPAARPVGPQSGPPVALLANQTDMMATSTGCSGARCALRQQQSDRSHTTRPHSRKPFVPQADAQVRAPSTLDADARLRPLAHLLRMWAHPACPFRRYLRPLVRLGGRLSPFMQTEGCRRRRPAPRVQVGHRRWALAQ